MTFTVRRGNEADAAELAVLAARTFRDAFAADNRPEDMALHVTQAYGESQQRRELVDSRVTTLVAVSDGTLIGYAQLRDGEAPACVDGSSPVELWRFYVSGEWHGRGVAAALMERVIGEGVARGADTLWLGVWERNARAQAFYRKQGFRDVGAHRFILGTDPQTDRIMVRPIPPSPAADRAEPLCAILVVTGASGAGKTTLVRGLASLGIAGVGCYEFDRIGIPSAAEIQERFGGGEGFQAWALDEWIARLARNDDEVAVAVLDAQVRPRAALDALRRHGMTSGAVVLVDCDYSERNARLHGPRGQPELATPQMDGWAAYLRGQADALDVPVIDTTTIDIDRGVDLLRAHVERLRSAG